MFHSKLKALTFLWLLGITSAHCDEKIIGYVKTFSPHAYLVTGDKTDPATIGSPVFVGSKVITDENGALGLTLKDNTLLSFGPDTEFEITDYIYQPSDDKLSLNMNLLKGTLHYISGVIAKIKPTAVKLKTPAGIIGARGTRFVVKVED